MKDEVEGLKGELIFQWKSGKHPLDSSDFEHRSFNKSWLSSYFKRARPAIALKTSKPTSRKNKEFAYYSFNVKDVCNAGLAMKCAVMMVT